MVRARAISLGFAGAVVLVLLGWLRWERRATGAWGEFVVFSAEVRGCAVIVPAQPSAGELRAATLVSETLARAAGRDAFPVVHEDGPGAGRGIFVGATHRGADRVVSVRRQPPFDDEFTVGVEAGAVTLRSARPEAIEITAGWFLERKLGAHWFMPGPLGAHVPPRAELRLAGGEERVRPGFLSRDLSVSDHAWYAANKLEARLEHGHSYNRIFTRDDLAKNPLLAPVLRGERYVPRDASDYGWQPDLLSPAAVAHAADFINRAFAADPQRISVALSENDTYRFDETPATLARVTPLKFFRDRPDYSPLVFSFTNAVADAVRAVHPDRWVPAYAYYWCENAPSFPIAPNVVPFLTADRSQWFEPEFAAEDRALIARWCRSGAKLVGVYDYFEGAPYLVPRPILYAVAESIPYEYAAGVRAFYGEGIPNWGLDGPKPWLAAQILWNPRQSPAVLLETYYREFWQEAAAPMRAFDECAERAWRGQPHPGYWIKYYVDEHQSLLFPPALRAEMSDLLERAALAAKSDLVRARVTFVSSAFEVSAAFAAFCESRDAVARATASQSSDENQLARLLVVEATARSVFTAKLAELRKHQPLAIQTEKLEIYLRNDPAGAARLRLSRSAAGRQLLAAADLPAVEARAAEVLLNPAWDGLAVGDLAGSISFDWIGRSALNIWNGRGEPCEHRSVIWTTDDAGARAVRFTGCKQEILSQMRDGVVPGQVYVGRTRVRARVSPGNATFLIVTFFDEKFQPFELGHTCRLPAGEQGDWTEIAVVETAPAKARYVGFGVRVLNQVNDDFAEFSGVSLRTAATNQD